MGRLAKRLPLLRRHGEVIATGALACLLDHDVLRVAFESLLEIRTDAHVRWVTEQYVVEGDRWGRMDLVRRSSSRTPRVVVEAKLGHLMSSGQIEFYASPADVGLVVLLVPASREAEAQQVLADCALPADTAARVVTWEAVIDALHDGAETREVAADVEQFTDLVRSLAGRVLEPFEDEAPRGLLDHRLDDLVLLVDYVTAALQQHFVPGMRRWPMGRDAIYLARRYVAVVPDGMHLAVGVVDRESEAGVLWLRYHTKTPGFPELDPVALEWQEAGRQATVRDWDGHLWIALHLPRQYDLPATVDALRHEVVDLHDALTGGSSGR